MFLVPIIETFSLTAPLGLCFHDAATGERVMDGLRVSVYPEAKSARRKSDEAHANGSGVYVLHEARGLEEFRRGAGDDEFWEKNPPQKNYIVEVFDRENRFQPFRLALKLPVKGIYRWENAPSVSPSKSFSSIPLYSAPARRIPGGMSVVRAELRESVEKPAAFAVLEARLLGKLIARGIADARGRIVLMFPSLAAESNPFTSPPNATPAALADQKWNLDLTVKYAPRKFSSSPAVEPDGDFLPDLRLALEQQSGTLWANTEKTESLTTVVLPYGRDLILRSRAPTVSPPSSAAAALSSYLFVSPAS